MKVTSCKFNIALVVFSFVYFSCNAAEACQLTNEQKSMLTGNKAYDLSLINEICSQVPKVIGGMPVAPGTYQWQIALIRSDLEAKDILQSQFCGGAVYSEYWIITAAHCVKSLNKNNFKVIAGTVSLNTNAKAYDVEYPIEYRQFDPKNKENDIALIKLAKPLPLGSGIAAIPIDTSTDSELSQQYSCTEKDQNCLTTTGWGQTEGAKRESKIRRLESVNLPYVSISKCQDSWAYGDSVKDTMLCAGWSSGNKGPCFGDSGGPLTSNALNSNPKLVGIVSWDYGCEKPNRYAVFTRASNYLKWVNDCATNSKSSNCLKPNP